ncbi:MAG: plasmid replication protein RepC [Pseudomonadota bacterium]
MSYIPITPFRRAVDGTLLDQIRRADDPLPAQSVNKWDILRALGVAKSAFNLTDRQLTVLQALLSFHPEKDLSPDGEPLIVFPSNATICERLNGMPCSTMRRHLARLVDAGLILRRDSPNGKRFRRKGSGNVQAFGLDLSPLLRRAEEIHAKADELRAEEDRIRQARQAASLMCRDLAALCAYSTKTYPNDPLWDQLADAVMLKSRYLRRKLSSTELSYARTELEDLLATAKSALDLESEESSTNDSHSEQHHQTSDKELDLVDEITLNSSEPPTGYVARPPTDIPLAIVLDHCTEAKNFSPRPINNWKSLVHAMNDIRPMMGVSPTVWSEAIDVMGRHAAATVLAVMLERFSELRSPNAYLRHLTTKSRSGEFSCIPMLVALGDHRSPQSSQL